MKKLRKRLVRLGLPILILVIAVIGAYFYFGQEEKIEYTTAKAQIGTITQTVSETGNIKNAEQLDLQFLSSGRIAKINTAVGKEVKKGDILAELDHADANIKIKQAQAQLTGANANLNKLLKGSTPEDIKIAEAAASQADTAHKSAVKALARTKSSTDEAVRQAQKTLDDLGSKEAAGTPQYQAVIIAQRSLEDLKSTLGQAGDNQRENTLFTAEDKLSTGYAALDAINKLLNDQSADNVLSVKNSSYLNTLNINYEDALILYDKSKTSLANAKIDKSDVKISLACSDSLSFLNKTLSALNNCFRVLENTITSSAFSQTSLDAYKTGINGQITLANAAITSLQNSKQALDTVVLNYHTRTSEAGENLRQAEASYNNAVINAGNALESAKKSRDQQTTAGQAQIDSAKSAYDAAVSQLEKAKAPARSSDIQYARSQVIQAQAGVMAAQKMIDDATIKAPLDGIVTKVNNDEGEVSSPQSPVISMLGNDKFEINVDISETDIQKIANGNQCTITFDAFGEDIIIAGDVFFIDPAQTVIQEVVFYGIKARIAGKERQTDPGADPVIQKLKPGMSANVTIETDKRENVLIIPMRAITDKGDEGKFVKILKDNQPSESKVLTGLQGDDGQIEVISGVNEGDDVVTFIK